MKMTPRASAAGPDPYPKVRQHYEREYKVRFSEGQWLEVQDEAMSGSGASRRPEAYLRRLHTTAERFAQFLSLGSPEPRRRRRRRPSEGKPRGPYARPLLARIDLVLHVNGCKSMAGQLGIRWLWRDFAEAHWKQTGIEDDPGVLERRHRAAKKMLHAAVPVEQRWLLSPEHRGALLRFLGVRDLTALAEEQERPKQWVQELEARLAADRAHVESVPAEQREHVRAQLEKQHATAVDFLKDKGFKTYHLPSAWEKRARELQEDDRVWLRSRPPVDPKQKTADHRARVAKSRAGLKRRKKERWEEDLSHMRSMSRE